MSANPHSREHASEVASIGETTTPTDSVEQIRDILFGQQIQEYEARFKHLEAQLVIENNNLKDLLEKRLDNLETELRGRIETTIETLEQERQERQSGQEALSATLQHSSGELLGELQAARENAAHEILEVRDHLQEQKKEIDQQLEHREDGLAGIFQEMANKIANRQG